MPTNLFSLYRTPKMDGRWFLESTDELEDPENLYTVAINFKDRWETLNEAARKVLDAFEYDPKTEAQDEAFDELEKAWDHKKL